MRPTRFSADTIISLLRKQTVASLPDVLVALGPRVSRRTAFRKLKDLDARTSYSHRGGYYTLDELADFDERGLWSFAGVRFSRAGTLVATAEAFVQHAEAGHFVDELDNLLHVGTQDALRKLAGDGSRWSGWRSGGERRKGGVADGTVPARAGGKSNGPGTGSSPASARRRRSRSTDYTGHAPTLRAVSCTNSAPSRHAVRIRSRMWTGRTPVCGRW